MIRINQNQINKFKKSRCEYLYFVSQGCFLAFDLNTFEYIGIELFYLPYSMDDINKRCNDKINYLLARDILEISD